MRPKGAQRATAMSTVGEEIACWRSRNKGHPKNATKGRCICCGARKPSEPSQRPLPFKVHNRLRQHGSQHELRSRRWEALSRFAASASVRHGLVSRPCSHPRRRGDRGPSSGAPCRAVASAARPPERWGVRGLRSELPSSSWRGKLPRGCEPGRQRPRGSPGPGVRTTTGHERQPTGPARYRTPARDRCRRKWRAPKLPPGEVSMERKSERSRPLGLDSFWKEERCARPRARRNSGPCRARREARSGSAPR